MKIFKGILVLGVVAAMFIQCAEKENEDYDVREQAVFDEWMERNHPQADRLESGMYIEWVRKGSSSAKPDGEKWVLVDYRGYDLKGNMISNRDSEVARREGTFTRRTHYVPHFAVFDPQAYALSKNIPYNYEFTSGEYEALGLLSVGDSVRIYLPSMLAYRTVSANFQYGYEGWYNSSKNPGNGSSIPSLSGNPVMIDLALREIVNDPEAREEAQAAAKAAELGLRLVKDTTGLYFKYIEPEEDEEGNKPEPPKDVIAEDSSFYMIYDVRLLDNFLVQTNDAVTAYVDWGDFTTTYSPQSYTVGASTLIGEAITELVKRETIHYGSRYKILFTSKWGYHYTGKSASATSPVIYPYTPLMMEIITMEYGYDPDADEEEETEE